MSIKCLMLETSDRRRFFTSLSCRKSLAEYCRAFNAKTYVVRAEIGRADLMTLQALVRVLCDGVVRTKPSEFKMIKGRKAY